MKEKAILDIFYNQIAKSAIYGSIDCYFVLNIGFDIIVENKRITTMEEPEFEGLLYPTMKITNKELFDSLLIEYVQKALEFYPDTEYMFLYTNDISYDANIVEDINIYTIKYIICLLLSNASYRDFSDPIGFLQSRIAMFDNKTLPSEETEIGYLNSIGATLYATEEKSPMRSETPYRIKSKLVYDDGYTLELPEIYAGNTGDKYQLYGIQKTTKTNSEEEKPYVKQIRKGLHSKINGAPEHYFLTIMLYCALAKEKEIEVIPFLTERWNAKRKAIHHKSLLKKDFDLDKAIDEQLAIQNNITEVIIRYFTKLQEITPGLDFIATPFMVDDRLHIKIDENIHSKSEAFNELIELTSKEKEEKRNFGR